MPKVGDKHFSYTPEGQAKADAYSEATGKEVQHKKYKHGNKLEGKLNGPSHKDGGIKFNLKGETQEAEGGEFVIKKDSVEKIEQKHGKQFLEKLNDFGGVPVSNAKERSKTIYSDGGEMTLKSGIAEMEKEKGKDWDKKLTAEDVAWDGASVKDIRKGKRDARKRIRKMKRTGIKKIRQEAKETRKSGEQVDWGKHWGKLREERKRKRKAIKAINRVDSGFIDNRNLSDIEEDKRQREKEKQLREERK